MKVISWAAILCAITLLTACASGGKKEVSDPTNKAEVSQKIYSIKTDFGEHRIYGPVIRQDFGGLMHNDQMTVQLIKTEKNQYYLRVYNWHSGNGWKFIESITTTDGKTTNLVDLKRDTKGCSSGFCAFEEIGFAPLSKSKYLSGRSDLKVRINAKKWGTQVMIIPKQYIQAFLEKAG